MIERQRFSNPDCQRCVIGKVVVREGMNKRRESRCLDQPVNACKRILTEVNLELGLWVRAHIPVPHLAYKKHARELAGTHLVREFPVNTLCGGAITELVVNMGVVGRALRSHWVPLYTLRSTTTAVP